MVTYIIGIFITQLVTDHIQTHAHAEESDLADLYGSLDSSMISLYMAITGGDDWGNLMHPLSDELSPLFAPFYVLYIAFSMFALLNVVTGLFVEKAMASALDDRDAIIQEQLAREGSYVNEVRAAFAEADQDGSGTITLDEFQIHLRDERVQAYFKSLELDPSYAVDLFHLLDLGDTGAVNTEEFVLGCLRLKGHAKSIDVATLKYESKRMTHQWNHFVVYVVNSFKQLGVDVQSTTIASLCGSHPGSTQTPQIDKLPDALNDTTVEQS